MFEDSDPCYGLNEAVYENRKDINRIAEVIDEIIEQLEQIKENVMKDG